jgi:predicted phage-related endonuclease
LEVKNHCPFFTNSFHGGKGSKNKGGKKKRFTIGFMPFDEKLNGVFAHYVPQLQLEMLCLGPECQSAVMVRQTATAGAILLRMHRDDDWIDEMLYWLHRFQQDYVEPKKPPPKNFFWESPNQIDRSRYRRFVNKTNEIRNSRVEVIARIHNDEIQRMGDHSSLFLD